MSANRQANIVTPDNHMKYFITTNPINSGFLTGVYNYFKTNGYITQAQYNAVCEIMARDKKKESLLKFPLTNQARVLELINKAKDSGIKHPAIRVSDPKGINHYKITVCRKAAIKDKLVNLKVNDKFIGRIDVVTGIFSESPNADKRPHPELLVRLNSILADTDSAIRLYGKREGNCSFCNRTLTTKESLYWNYGPICAEHYGLPWELSKEELDRITNEEEAES